jgi:hypothetical protein
MIKNVYGKYFQKSRIFLYPALDIHVSNFMPYQTYVAWDNELDLDAKFLICVFDLQSTPEFHQFEKARLMNHVLFEDYYELSSGRGAYIFRMAGLPIWDAFISGNYSKFPDVYKDKIIKCHGISTANKEHLESYLYPEKYYRDYARALDIDESVLQEVGQLCSPPNLKKEKLTVLKKELDFSNK